MKKKLVLFMVFSLFILCSCRSLTTKGRSVNAGEKFIEKGQYYEGILEFTNALVADPDYKPAIEGLNSVFQQAIEKQEDTINNAKTASSPVDYAGEVEKMALIYKNVVRLSPETFALLNFKLELEDIKKWNLETAKAYYDAAESYTPRLSTFDYKTIAKLYKKSYLYNSKYEDNFNKYKEFKDLAMQKIVYFNIKSEYNYFNIGSLLTQKIFNSFNSDNDLSEFTKFINGDLAKLDKNNLLTKQLSESELKDNNYLLDLEITSIQFPRANPKTNFEKKRWYEVAKNEGGVIKKRVISDLPKTKDPLATYTENNYTKISNYKEVSAKMSLSYNLIDLKTKSVIKSGVITEESKDSHTSILFIGTVNPNETPVLDRALDSDSILLEKTAVKISESLKNTLNEILK